MNDKLENASFFKRAVETFGLPPERAEKIAAQMAMLGVDRDDAYLLLFMATGKVEALAETIPAEMIRAGKGTIAGVRKAMDEALASMPERLSGSFDAHMQDVAASLSTSVQRTVDQEARRRVMVRLGGAGLAVALLVAAALTGGYYAGQNVISSQAAKWDAVVSLPDGGRWLALAKLNNIDRALAQGCTAGEGRVVAGGRVCDVPLYVSPPVATSSGTDAVRLSFAEWTNRLGVWGILALGAVAGFIAGRFWKRREY